MATIAACVIVIWPGTNAGIPSGWARETALDATYPKGTPNACDPGGTGGTLTHSHTTTTHLHSGDHTHTVPNSPAAADVTARDAGGSRAPPSHTHDSNPATVVPTGSLATQAPSTGSPNHEPPFRDVIFIKSDGTPTGVPASGITLWFDTASAPTNWYLANGASARIDLRNYYPKGASTSGDSGASGGATTHVHTLDSHNHSTPFSHNHPNVTSTTMTQGATGSNISGGTANTATLGHTHPLVIGTCSGTISSCTDSLAASSNQPLFTLLAHIQNDSGGLSYPDRVIGLWLNTLTTIPQNWVLCDGTGGSTPDLRTYFVKGASVLADSGASSGGLTHKHTATGHSHDVASHAHTVTAAAGASVTTTAGATNISTGSHTHSAWSDTGAKAFTASSTTPVIDNYTNTQPPFKEVAFIQWQVPAAASWVPLHRLELMSIMR